MNAVDKARLRNLEGFETVSDAQSEALLALIQVLPGEELNEQQTRPTSSRPSEVLKPTVIWRRPGFRWKRLNLNINKNSMDVSL